MGSSNSINGRRIFIDTYSGMQPFDRDRKNKNDAKYIGIMGIAKQKDYVRQISDIGNLKKIPLDPGRLFST